MDEIVAFDCGGYEGASQYYEHSREYTNALSCDSARLSEQLGQFVGRLSLELPERKRVLFYAEDDYEASGILWFNHAAALLEDCDMIMTLLNEGIIESPDELEGRFPEADYIHREKRKKAVARLGTLQHTLLVVGAMGILQRFSHLDTHYIALLGYMEGMDYQQALLADQGGNIIHHQGMWL